MELLYKQEFYDIKSACIELKNELGLGFLEKVYENALKIELEERGFVVEQQYQNCTKSKRNYERGNYFRNDSSILS